MGHLAKSAHLSLLSNPVSAATTTITGTWVDMQNYEGALFMCTLGTASTGATIGVKYAASTTASGTAISAASVSFAGATDDNKAAAIDVYASGSLGRYLAPTLTFVAGAGTIDFSGFTVLRYGPRGAPKSSTGLVDGDIDLVVIQTT